MSSLLSSPEPIRLPSLPAPVADPGYLKVVVAFDDQAAYRRALKLCVRVCSELEEGLRVQPLPWTPDYLGRSDWPPLSPRQAAEADIVVVAASEPEEVPAVVLSWVEQCCAQPRTAAGLLVALLGDSGDDDSNSFLAEGLRAIAARTHFAYLAPEHLGELPVGRDLAPRPPRAAPRRAAGG